MNWYSATPNLTFSDLYIFMLRTQQFCFYLPEALFNTSKTWFQMKGLVVTVRNNLVYI